MSFVRSDHSMDPAILYATNLFVEEDEFLLKAKSEAERSCIEGMMVSPLEGKILYTLLKIHGARKVVEIGGLTGYSAIWMARALPEEGHVYSFELDTMRASRAESLFELAGLERKISVVVGDAEQTLRKIEHLGPFDAIFIDANKSAYPHYLRWAESHLRVGGLIIGDNTFLWGQVWKMQPDSGTTWSTLQSMKEFNQRLADSSRFESVILPTCEGMTIAVKKF